MITTAIEINPNLRFADGGTAVEFDDVTGPLPSEGERVAVFERQSRIFGTATVTRVRSDDLELAVDWGTLSREEGALLDLDLDAKTAIALVNQRDAMRYVWDPQPTFARPMWIPLSDRSTMASAQQVPVREQILA